MIGQYKVLSEQYIVDHKLSAPVLMSYTYYFKPPLKK